MNKILFSFLSGLLLAIAYGPIFISYFKNIHFNQYIREDGPKSHLKKQGTPSFGGFIFIFAFTITCLVFKLLVNEYSGIILSCIGFGLIGFCDDYLKVYKKQNEGLKPMQKIFLSVFVGTLIFFMYKNYIDVNFFGIHMKNYIILMYPLFLFISMAVTNAVNLTDGIDGLSASVTAIVSFFFAIIAYKKEMYNLCIMDIAFMGSLIGYLFYNVYPAKTMMGDTGSFAMGGFVLMNVFMLDIIWWLLIFGFVYVFETLSVIIQVTYFKATKKRFFKMAPFHHHLEQCGWNEYKIVIVLDLVTFLLCLISYVGITRF